MKRAVLICCIAGLLFPGPVSAKKNAAPAAKTVVRDGISFVSSTRRGYIEAWDITKNRKLWEKKVYGAGRSGGDAQPAFIKSIVVKDGALLVFDELGRSYTVKIPGKFLRNVRR